MSDKNPGAPKNLRKQDPAAASARTAKNARLRAERHANRMVAQRAKRLGADGCSYDSTGRELDIKVPRGTARRLRRAPLAAVYAKRRALGNVA